MRGLGPNEAAGPLASAAVHLIAMIGPSFNLHFAWVQHEKGRWLIDGAASCRALRDDDRGSRVASPKREQRIFGDRLSLSLWLSMSG